jgi:threonine aldolase
MTKTLYETDFYSWAYQQAQLLRQGEFQALDQVHLIEEIEDLGNRHYDQLESRLVQLIAHLLKWQFQQNKQTNSWRATIRVQRVSLEKLLRRNPGLQSRIAEAMAESWTEARILAVEETNLPDEQFPQDCPYTFEEAINPNFWPF